MRLLAVALLLPALLPPLCAAEASQGIEVRLEPGTLLLTPGGAASVRIDVLNHGATPRLVEVDVDEVRSVGSHEGRNTFTMRLDDRPFEVPAGGRAGIEVQFETASYTPIGTAWELPVVARAGGETATALLRVEAAEVPPPQRIAQLAAATGAAAAVAAAAGALSTQPALRGALAAPAVALYSRIGRSEALTQETRRRLLDLVGERPGLAYAELMSAAGLGAGALAHHLRVLEREGLVVSRRQGRRRRLFHMGHPASRGRAPEAPSPAAERVLRELAREPLTQRELAGRLGMTQQGVSHHVRSLERRGLLRAEPAEGALRWRAAAWPLKDR